MSNTNCWVQKRTGKKRASYSIQWHDPRSGRIKTKTIGCDRTLARLRAAERQRELESGQRIGITSISYEDFVTEHVEQISGTLAERTVTEHDLVLRQFDESCQPKDLTVIDFTMLEKFRKSRLSEGLSLATANKSLATLQGILSRGVQRGYIVSNPFTGNRKSLMMRVPEKEPQVISLADFEKLLSACKSDQWRAIIRIAYHAGLRRGEILALEWRDIDFAENVIHVRNSEHHLTKSRKNRIVPMTHQVAAALRRLRLKMLKSDLVFTNERGVKIRNNHDRGYQKIAKRAGLLDDKGNPRYGLHDLRRSCATELQRSGVSMKTTQRILGHASMSTTAKYYTGVEEKDLRDAIKRLETQTG